MIADRLSGFDTHQPNRELFGQALANFAVPFFGGVLIATAYHMVRIDELRQTAKQSRLDALVLLATLVATVVLDLISALLIELSLYLTLRRTRISKRLVPIDSEDTLGD